MLTTAAARADLQQWLERVISRGALAREQVPDLINRLNNNDAPFPRARIPALSDAAIQQAALQLLALAFPGRHELLTFQEALDIIAAWKLSQLLNLHEQVQTQAEERNGELAALLFLGAIAIGEWQDQMMQGIVFHNLKQGLLGGRGRIRNFQLVEELLTRDSLFLTRFADEIAVRKIVKEQPLSEAAVLSRSNLYTGPGRGIFYRELEQSTTEALRRDQAEEFGLPRIPRRPNALEGWVVQYIARDDLATCDPCHDAQGWYLPNQGPWPGLVCEGRGQCRCRRVIQHDPEIYATLVRG